ncbi:hypothetical protein ABVK25_002911 [Lepraria finkii]|uniref:Uncharacterized protein n=1 Tax=Lepraria finkii TaxID=1340010 RepID=A0ABR4BF91_9LECA
MEPMFNFRSLAAMVGHDDKIKDTSLEDAEPDTKASSATTTHDNSRLPLDGTAEKTIDTSDMEIPSFKITASSRTNSDFDDTKHAAMGDENISRDDIHASS